ncbi:alpha/beta hydrolase fold domain-containing protein [Yersinia pseudotuberculosis]|uniref:alpha/beta hydrolase fold domain-containing protein n=1 Tax=Yersinia pseudotuberculosis TaxID=633 RepID=UPI0005EA1B62|nr:alpha/beta hydrolase [Yersinia pseudotuberculosis]CND48229.1 alpha/beta hydrolase domain-containing protein [Yersinia pseudotuberculosis]
MNINTVPLATDFANLLAARRLFFGKGAQHETDYGRQRVARWIANVSAPLSGKIEVTGHVRRFIPEKLRSAEPIFYLHGGGLVYYSTEVFSAFLSTLAHISGREIRAFDYPKAPEPPMAELVGHLEQQLSTELNHVDAAPCLMGDSVGGLLMLWFAGSAFSQAFSQIHLLYPALASHHNFDSFRRYGEGYLLDAAILRWFAEHWFPWCRQQQFDPLASDYAFSKLPPVVLHTTGYDVLTDEGLAFAALARQAGASLQHYHHPALPHDFCLYAGKLASSRQAVEQIAAALDIEHKFPCKQ